MYYFFHFLGFFALAGYTLTVAPKYGFKRIKSLICIALIYSSVYALMLLIFYFITGKFGGQNIVRVFIFVPPVALLYGMAMGMKPGKILDMVAPGPCIVHGISHLGCLFPGCCYSNLKVDWGIYNAKVGATLFPVQICESITALAIAAFVIWIAKSNKYNYHGRTMPLMLLFFGATRFGWEFLRDNEKLFAGISELAIWAAATAFIGAIWLIVDSVLGKKAAESAKS